MYGDQFREDHPLLTKDEFKEAVVGLGFAQNTGGLLFNAIVRRYRKNEDEPRSAVDSVFYEVIHNAARPEYVVSLSNLADKIPKLEEVRTVGKMSIAALRLLTEPYQPEPNGEFTE